jgi:ribosomal-protein-alanine N-acetyltransferase
MPPKDNSPDRFTISQATLADAKMICAFERTLSQTPWSEAAFCGDLANELGANFIAFDEAGAVCAFIIGVVILDELHINNLAVAERFRRKGIAMRLLDMAVRHARGIGALQAFLEVRLGNAPAIGLYEKYGFIRRFIRKKYYSSNDEDALVMTMVL